MFLHSQQKDAEQMLDGQLKIMVEMIPAHVKTATRVRNTTEGTRVVKKTPEAKQSDI